MDFEVPSSKELETDMKLSKYCDLKTHSNKNKNVGSLERKAGFHKTAITTM